MTHCVCCDKLLSDYEATLRHGVTFEYLDTCKECLKPLKGLFPVIERKALITESDIDDENDNEDYNLSGAWDSGDYEDTLMYFRVNSKDLDDF
jgi:hypothetical protein